MSITKPFVLVLVLSVITPLTVYAKKCENKGNIAALYELKAQQFVIKDDNKRNKTAIELLSCLGHRDPDIRDGIVYEGLSHWLRGKQLTHKTTEALFKSLIATLTSNNQDQDNFTQPFASLVLAEVIRVDRITPYLSVKDRQRVVEASTLYMIGITDYRGFNDKEGWRHAVAHTADVFLQLALNKNISKAQLDQLLDALKAQISPNTLHFYTYGEPKRLATAFAYIILRGEHDEEQVSDILSEIANPSPYSNWGAVYKSEAGLAKLHNIRSFIYSLLAITRQSKNPNLIAIQSRLLQIVRDLG